MSSCRCEGLSLATPTHRYVGHFYTQKRQLSYSQLAASCLHGSCRCMAGDVAWGFPMASAWLHGTEELFKLPVIICLKRTTVDLMHKIVSVSWSCIKWYQMLRGHRGGSGDHRWLLKKFLYYLVLILATYFSLDSGSVTGNRLVSSDCPSLAGVWVKGRDAVVLTDCNPVPNQWANFAEHPQAWGLVMTSIIHWAPLCIIVKAIFFGTHL